MMQPPRPPRDDDSVAAANSNAGDSFTTMSNSSQHPHLRPILVGYAFGPKKMSTMGLIMAEASRAKLSTVITAEVPIESFPPQQTSHLTTAALQQAQESPRSTTKPSVVLSMSRGPSGGFRNIVRYFRSSCSSIASDDTLTTATSTANTPLPSTGGSSRTARQQRHPVRVSFVPLDLDSPLEEQHGGNFDVILHKLTEDILCLSTLPEHYSPDSLDESQLQAISRVKRLNQYQQDHPTCSLVDHPSYVETVMSRLDIAHVLSICLVGVSSASGIPVKTPAFEVYTGQESTTFLQPPLIAKPLSAAGTKKSHCMGVVLRLEGLAHVYETPCLLQEYVNHNAILHKVYVMGDHVSVFYRPSLPNLPECGFQEGFDYCEFDSQRPYPTLADFGLQGCAKRPKLLSEHGENDDDMAMGQQVTAEEIRPVVDVLKRAFGLELFGFDILVTFQGELLVVDVNYFPSYKEVSNFPSLLANYLTQRAIDGRMNSPAKGEEC
mmetsp:Transcript_30305/g.54822  ORF Transcript_30305/g.54822 Transcript_30305/m.54822 type:complete len:493 (+) Transcript_30305:274-1752(+)